MKIGSSLSRCVPDIVNGKVSLNEIVLIISGTAFPLDQGVINFVDDVVSYHSKYPDWVDIDLDACRHAVLVLVSSGRIYQPRLGVPNQEEEGRNYATGPTWYDLTPSPPTDHPLVEDAWQQYRTAVVMSGAGLRW